MNSLSRCLVTTASFLLLSTAALAAPQASVKLTEQNLVQNQFYSLQLPSSDFKRNHETLQLEGHKAYSYHYHKQADEFQAEIQVNVYRDPRLMDDMSLAKKAIQDDFKQFIENNGYRQYLRGWPWRINSIKQYEIDGKPFMMLKRRLSDKAVHFFAYVQNNRAYVVRAIVTSDDAELREQQLAELKQSIETLRLSQF